MATTVTALFLTAFLSLVLAHALMTMRARGARFGMAVFDNRFMGVKPALVPVRRGQSVPGHANVMGSCIRCWRV